VLDDERTTKVSDNPEFYPGMVYSDLKRAMAWLEKAFGFRTLMAIENEDGSYAHVEMAYNNVIIMPSGPRREWTWKSPQDIGATTASIYMFIPDADIADHFERARAAGAEIVMPLERKDYGGSGYTARDLDGHYWSFGSYRPSLTPS
jgi:uncharacterized glyoxalase superfamily protein PhnB